MSTLLSSSKRVLMLCTDLGYGGAEASFAKVSRLLAKRYFVICVAFNADITKYYPLGGELLLLDEGMGIARNWSIFRYLHRVRRLKQIKLEYKVDASISFLEGADYVNFMAATDARNYASIRGTKIFDEEISGWKGWIRKHILMHWVYPRLDGIIAVSSAIKDEVQQHFRVPPKNVRTIYNFYDALLLRSLADEPLPDLVSNAFSQYKVVINVGRLHIQKNQEALLQVISHIVKIEPNVRLALIGDGPLEQYLYQICDDIGLTYWTKSSDLPFDPEAHVWFFGYQANPHAYTSKSLFFAFPSRWEGFPNALAEAMMCGIPVISADCPTGPREILAPDLDIKSTVDGAINVPAGILAIIPKVNEKLTIEVWVGAFLTLIRNDTLTAIGHNALHRASDFTEEAVTPLWEEVIEAKI